MASPSHDADGPQRQASPSPTVATEAPVIEVASSAGDDDEFDLTEDPFNDGSTSVTSSVYACTFERGEAVPLLQERAVSHTQ